MTEQFGLEVDWQTPRGDDELLFNSNELKDNELHLWCLPLQLSEKQSAKALNLLSDIQKDKYHRRRPELKQSYLAGRFYLLNLLASYTSTTADKVLLSYSRLNKPYLSHGDLNTGDKPIQFNFSDTQVDGVGFGLFAFCKSHSVGVDLESLHRDIDFSAIAKKRFSDEELEYVTDSDGNISNQRSLAIWTRKEAFGKATGKGINFQMNKLNLIGTDSFELNFEYESEPWRLQQIQLKPNFIACVCHQQHQKLDIKAFASTNHIP